MPIILLFLISSAFALPCGANEIYVREQLIKAYTKNDGTKVAAHSRKAHCRELTRFNYFLNETKQIFKGVKTNIKKWSPEEKKIVEEHNE